MFVYFDETIGGLKNELTAVAGYLFSKEGAGQFREAYQKNVEPRLPVDKHGRKMFRSAHCFDGDGAYKGMDRAIREHIFGRMVETINRSATLGVVVAVEHSEYEAGLKGRYVRVTKGGASVPSLEPFVGSKYSLCLLRCIQNLNGWLDKKGVSRDETIEYSMESGYNPKVEQEAITILSNVAASGVLKEKYRLGRYGFNPKGPDDPWFFAADLLAWFWQRRDRERDDKSETRGDWRTPATSLVEGTPLLGSYLSESFVNTSALVNSFHGLLREVPTDDASR